MDGGRVIKRALRLTGYLFVHAVCSLVAPALSADPVQAPPLPPADGQTEMERTQHLERKLNGLLEAFDEMLLREKELLSERQRDAEIAEAESGDSGQGDGPDGELNTEAAGGAGPASQRSGGALEKGDSRHARTYSGRGSGGAAVGPPASDGDDVVARQLREAAEQESDPALKKKLWDEYRRYKQGAGG